MSTTLPTHSPPVHSPPGRGSTIAGYLPNILVFVLLAAAFYGGHQTGWKMPKLSTLLSPEAAAMADWCSEHSVPESICVECQKDLMPLPKDYGFCTVRITVQIDALRGLEHRGIPTPLARGTWVAVESSRLQKQP